MKSLLRLYGWVLAEAGTRCCTRTDRDWKTIRERVEHEGLSFLTITLPSFGEDLERSLELGSIETHAFRSFRKRGAIPLLFSGMLSQVFDRECGTLLEEPSVEAIRSLRQVCRLFGKIELPCSQAREVAAYRQFVKTEGQVVAATAGLTPRMLNDFRRVGRLLFRTAFSQVEYDIFHGLLLPKHGPGATADGLRGNSKYRQTEWPERLETYFPMLDMILGSYRSWESLDSVTVLSPEQERPVKVVSVPKTLKTPRIIAIEPTCMQYAQQAVARSIREHCRHDQVVSRVINFEDQTPNQRLARIASEDRRLATIDLSEASDRVSNRLVQELLADWPSFDGAVQACRSLQADVPGIGVIPLTKFASMGSALTFPIEAFVFTTIVFLGIERSRGYHLTRREILDLTPNVQIFGDDLVVPVDDVLSIIECLEDYGLKVNRHKSFWRSKFRESCGGDYYDGEDVTSVRVRRMIPSDRPLSPSEKVSLVSLRNQLYEHGWWDTTAKLDRVVRRVLPVFPVTLPSSQALGRRSFLGYQTEKIGGPWQAPLVKAYVTTAAPPASVVDGDAALLKCFLEPLNGVPYPGSEDRLLRAGRPRSVGIKIAWVSPF